MSDKSVAPAPLLTRSEIRKLLVIVAVVAVGWFTLRGDSPPEAAEPTLNRAQNEGWYDAIGDCDRDLPYGWSAAQLARTQVDSTYKADYFEYYVDAWSYGIGVGLCSAIEDAGMASGAQFLPTP